MYVTMASIEFILIFSGNEAIQASIGVEGLVSYKSCSYIGYKHMHGVYNSPLEPACIISSTCTCTLMRLHIEMGPTQTPEGKERFPAS